MARLATLDADVLIGHLDGNDAQHGRATRVLVGLVEADIGLAISTITLAEVLVAPIRAGVGAKALDALAALAIAEIPLAVGAAERLATIRAETGCRMPDCCVLHAAAASGSTTLASFDRRLCKVAAERGLKIAG